MFFKLFAKQKQENKVRTALVTGSSRGIGKAIAIRLAREGYNIVINYKEQKDAANQTASEVSKFSRCIVVRADVSSKEQVERLYQQAKAAFGFVDTVINNAGVAGYKLLIDESEQEYDRIMNTNIKGCFLVSQRFLPDMISNSFGRIVNISSIYGTCGAAMETIYSASKGAIIGFTKALSKEVLPMGITVNAIAPGAIDTDMLACFDAEAKKRIAEKTMAGRMGRPEDVASAVLAFVSKETEFVSGQVLTVSGELLYST